MATGVGTTSTNTPSETTRKIHELMSQTTDQKTGWTTLWTQKLTPWNIGRACPPMTHLLNTHPDLRNRSLPYAYVPGCGEGWDVAWLAQRTGCFKAVGIDVSPLAIHSCQQRHSTANTTTSTTSTTPNSTNSTDNMEFRVEDFFEYLGPEKVQQQGGFDFCLDYTFLCALPPSMRTQWADQMIRVVRPGGQGLLMTIMFPLGEFEGGPPFALSVQTYKDLLEPRGFRCIYGPEPSDYTVDARKGRELVAIWTRNE